MTKEVWVSHAPPARRAPKAVVIHGSTEQVEGSLISLGGGTAARLFVSPKTDGMLNCVAPLRPLTRIFPRTRRDHRLSGHPFNVRPAVGDECRGASTSHVDRRKLRLDRQYALLQHPYAALEQDLDDEPGHDDERKRRREDDPHPLGEKAHPWRPHMIPYSIHSAWFSRFLPRSLPPARHLYG
jgi:hypothetical protein